MEGALRGLIALPSPEAEVQHGGSRQCYLFLVGNLDAIKDALRQTARDTDNEKPGINVLDDSDENQTVVSVEFGHWRTRTTFENILANRNFEISRVKPKRVGLKERLPKDSFR